MDGMNGNGPAGGAPQIDLYEILGVSKTASKNEIKKAYHKAAMKNHPDKVAPEDREESEHRFKAAGQAYEILSDDQKRGLYDQHGMAAFEGGGAGAGMDVNMEDILNMFGMGGGIPGMGGAFGGMGGGGARQRMRKSPDENQKYEVSLEDLYKGKTVKFSSTKQVLCSKCSGSGGKDGAKAQECSTCKGQGVRQVVSQVGPMLTQRVVPCGACEGTGEIWNDKDKCKKCKGKKTTEEKKQLELYIPPGSKEGDQIRLEGEADQVPGTEQTGDIVFHLVELPDDNFQRTGNDLSAKLDVTLAEALFGFNRVVLKHLDGRGIELNHPIEEGKILRPQDVLKIPGEGMPIKRSEAKGDLYLIVEVEFPEDGFFSDPSTIESLKKMLPSPAPAIEADIVDPVDYEEADIEDIGGEEGRGQWEDEDEAQGAQCQTQ